MLNFLPKFEASRGFTIIELLIAVFIISTLGVMSISFYSRFLTQNTVDNTTNTIVQSLRKAQIYSMSGKQNGVWGVKYTSSPNKITLYLTGNSAFDESFTVNSNITITGFFNISFAKASGSPNTEATIVILGNNNSKTITINSQGGVKRIN